MPFNSNIIIKAEFNPKIKTYILLFVAFFLFISIVGIPILIIWFLGLGQSMSNRYYQNLKCQLTEKHLEFKKGILFRVEKTIPLENIQDLTFIENPLLRALDLRILKIETAGQSTPQGSDMKLVGIIDSIAFKEAVLSQREILKSKSYYTTENVSSTKTEKLLEEIRDLLKDINNK